MTAVLYRLLFRLVLTRLDAERAHVLTLRGLQLVGRIPGLTGALRRLLAPRDPFLRTTALGRTFPSPLGVAAGLDKDAGVFAELGALGFGWVEVGTLTPRPQPGNPKPRVHRLADDRALLNSMGFPNDGAPAAAARLARRRRPGGPVVAVNVGKQKETPPEETAGDYRAAVRPLALHADFVVVNVSSPNTPGLRDLQTAERLGEIVDAVREELAALGRPLPVLVKIAPDLPDEDIDAIADLATARGLDGLVAVNTTISRDGLREHPALAGHGGVCGPPLAPRAREVLRRLRARVGDELVLVSVGGIDSAEEAHARLQAGATLVQAYAGFVYGGPLWAWRLNRELAKRLRAQGAAPPELSAPASAPARA